MNQKRGKSKTAKPAIGIALYIKMAFLLNKNSIYEMTSSNKIEQTNGSPNSMLN